MAKQLLFNDDARRKLKVGIDTLALAVKTTLGPKGRNVALDRNMARQPLPMMALPLPKKFLSKIHMRIWAHNC